MYIHVVEHKGREQSVLAAQLIGFMYESHCWVDGTDAGYKACLWCEAISREDMKMDDTPGGEPILCPENPITGGADFSEFFPGMPKPTAKEVAEEMTRDPRMKRQLIK
jgi:hypothetical protein